MTFIPVNITYTNQSDFQGSEVTSINIDAASLPGSILLNKTNTQNIQTLNSGNNFGGVLTANLEISNNKVIIKPFTSRLMNIVPSRTKNTSEDYLILPYAPIDSLILKVDGLNITQGVDYILNSSTGRIDLIGSFSLNSTFEASYLSQGILACEGSLETDAINIGFGATTLEISNVGTNLEATQIWIKTASNIVDLDARPWALLTGASFNLSLTDKFLKLKFSFVPNDFETTTFPVTFKYQEDWNLAGSSFQNTVLNDNQRIQIVETNNSITNITSLPVPITLAGADYFKDSTTNNFYLITAGGFESPTTPSRAVRFAKIKPDHTIEEWITTKQLPASSVPYNGTKVVKINDINYLYVLNNNKSKDLYRSIINHTGAVSWNTQLALPRNIEKANLEVISDNASNSHFLLVQNNENIYWAQINNLNGNILNDKWESFHLPEKQRASATALVKSSSDPNTWYFYILGGVIGTEVQRNNTDLITKITITLSGSNLSFQADQIITKIPKKLSHFTAEIISFNTDQYLYIFGGTETPDAFSDKAFNTIYRAPLDLSTGNLTGAFSASPNKLYTASSGHNTITVPENGSLCTYVIGDSLRASSRVSCLNIVETASEIRSGTFRTGIFEVPGCNIQYSSLIYDATLRNNNQSVTAKYRISDTEANLLAAPFITIQNGATLVGNENHKLIQFEFDLAKDPNGSSNELSPVLNYFSFVFSSNISDSSMSPELLSSTLTFDNTLFEPNGEILFRFDSQDSDTEYSNLHIDSNMLSGNESFDVFYRVGNNFPLTGSYNPLNDFFTTTVSGRYFETKIILNSSTDQLFSPVINEVAITGVQPQNVSSSVDQFVFHEVPAGDQDQSNRIFTTAHLFEPSSLQVFVNGAEQMIGITYIEGSDQQSFEFISYAPDALDVIFVNYIKPL